MLASRLVSWCTSVFGARLFDGRWKDMDPLALLSDDDDDDDDDNNNKGGEHDNNAATPCRISEKELATDGGGGDVDEAEPEAKRCRVTVDFEALRRAGYVAGGAVSEQEEKAAAEVSLRTTFAALEAEKATRVAEEMAARWHGRDGAEQDEQKLCEEQNAEIGCEVPPDSIEVYDESGGGQLDDPWETFDAAEASLGKAIVDVMRGASFERPMPIQAHTWPILAAGRDLIGVAKTGSGKTLAFLLPCFAKLMSEKSASAAVKAGGGEDHLLPVHMQKQAAGAGAYSPQVLVLAPSRELVMQIETEAKKFSVATGISTLACYGGAGLRREQLGRLRERPDCVVGSVGRLNDFIGSEKHWFGVRTVRFLILDEADHMLGEGLSTEIRNITTDVETPHRQTMMFSATFDEQVRDLASWILRRPVEVRVGMRDPLRANKDVEQHVLIVKDERDKEGALKNILRKHYSPGARNPGKILVFCVDPETCDELAKKMRGLMSAGIDTLHSNRNQSDREKAILAFREGNVSVLFATNLAGRGLDIKEVKLVVNFDPPEDALDYVHRIGRTGRAGQRGSAITLLRRGPDGRAMAYIAQVMRRTGKFVPKDLIDALKQRRGRDMEFAAALLEGLCNFRYVDRNVTVL
eukprot:TRINITY_DN14352_c4_g1_i1.p1 TRINITY_DN14352_c4_g1~~TRINITY_DN14352_c4_g1_i1.p1  ORF type:complete len:636 (+),score=147.47 TRINITY_DN14352_c4_g1_i1:41-1948(+)